MRKDLTELPEWHEVCKRYRYDITRFAIEALGMTPTLQQQSLFASVAVGGSRTSVASGHGCFGIDTPIMLYDGKIKAVQDITTNDVLMGNDGTPRNVLELYRGKENMYRFIYNDGTSHIFNESHKLCVIDWVNGEHSIITVRDFNKKQEINKYRYSCYRHLENFTKRQIINIKSVEPLGMGDYYGFELDGNHQFLGGDFTVLHNTGKTRSAGVIALWHLLFFPHSVMMFTAPQIDQLRKLVFKEIAICLGLLKSHNLGWLADYIVILAESVYIKGHQKTWHIIAKTAPKNQPTNLAGQHGDNYMVWVDEACGVDDAVLDVVMGALTHKDNRAVMTSQPARPNGFFFDSHHKLAKKNGGVWNALTFNGEESPIVSDEVIKEQLLRYGSRDDAGYMIRIRGLFPDLGNEFLITHSEARKVFQGRSIGAETHKGYGYVAAVDVGGGTGRDDSVITIARMWGFDDFGEYAKRVDIIDIPLCRNNDDLYDIAGCLKEQIRKYPNLSIIVDTTGAGTGLKQHLTREGIYFEEVNWGRPCFANKDKDIYTNDRALASVCLQRAVKAGNFKVLTPLYRSKIEEQLTRLPYKFDEKGRYKIPSKEDMRRNGISSPDIVDTFAFLFLRQVYVVPAKQESMRLIDNATGILAQKQAALQDLADLIA